MLYGHRRWFRYLKYVYHTDVPVEHLSVRHAMHACRGLRRLHDGNRHCIKRAYSPDCKGSSPSSYQTVRRPGTLAIKAQQPLWPLSPVPQRCLRKEKTTCLNIQLSQPPASIESMMHEFQRMHIACITIPHVHVHARARACM